MQDEVTELTWQLSRLCETHQVINVSPHLSLPHLPLPHLPLPHLSPLLDNFVLEYWLRNNLSHDRPHHPCPLQTVLHPLHPCVCVCVCVCTHRSFRPQTVSRPCAASVSVCVCVYRERERESARARARDVYICIHTCIPTYTHMRCARINGIRHMR